MIYFKPKHFKASDGSHLPILVRLVLATMAEGGPVLELGTGFFSTPMLHWLCAPTKRRLVSCESSDTFIAVANNYIADFHEVLLVKDWSQVDIESQHWSVVLVDHAPGPQRKIEIPRLVNNADYVVVHDTEPNSDKYYHYSEVMHLYKYRYRFDKVYPHTTVLSNLKDLADLCKL